LENYKKLFKKAKTQQSLLKIDALLKDSLVKLNSVIRALDKNNQHIMVLAQVTVNLSKTQRLLKQISDYVEKTPLENSSGRNP
jgi:hypothetical protein